MNPAYTAERLLDRAERLEAIAGRWSGNPGFADNCRLEAAACRFMAKHQAEPKAPTELEQKLADFQHAMAQGSIVEGSIEGKARKIEIKFHTENAARKALDALLRFTLHGVQLPKAGGTRK